MLEGVTIEQLRTLRAVARLVERGEPGLPDHALLEAGLVDRGALPVSFPPSHR